MMTVALKSWTALGTSVHVITTLDQGLEPAAAAVRRVLLEVDAAYSRFRKDSELTGLNASAGRTISVSPLLATAIEAALRAARLTNGAVDPTIGRAIRVVGYDDDFSRIAADRARRPDNSPAVGADHALGECAGDADDDRLRLADL